MTRLTSFASDNYAGVHPQVMAALAAANHGHAPAYGGDPATAELAGLVREHFGDQAQVYPVFNGTGANVVALQAMARPWEAAVCAVSSHVNADEGGAPEKVAGLKLWQVSTPDGKLTPDLLRSQAWGFGDVHRAQPTVVTVTQSTELGTVYSVAELADLVDAARQLGMRVHVDGARIANAAAMLEVPLRAFTTDIGVDAVSFGGTKNGAMGAEAVVVLDPDDLPGVAYLRKSAMQLASKMRFISAQLVALLRDGLWLRNAEHSNAMAARLHDKVRRLPGVQITRPPQANAVFAVLPAEATRRLQREFDFYVWDSATGEVRWMCAWDTVAEDVDRFAAAVADALTG